MLIHVGTRNPAKVSGAQKAAVQYWPSAVVVGVEVQHGVVPQPLTREETIAGALKRAKLALDGADIGLGIEGGVHPAEYGMAVEIWAAAVNAAGRVTTGCGMSLLLPADLAALVRGGVELGVAVDRVFGLEKQHQKGGVVELLTGGAVTRAMTAEMAVLFALAPLR